MCVICIFYADFNKLLNHTLLIVVSNKCGFARVSFQTPVRAFFLLEVSYSMSTIPRS